MSKSGTDVAYQYNADGLRTKKTVTQSGASTMCMNTSGMNRSLSGRRLETMRSDSV
ncbi:MAG: hypothetical protein ACLTB5_07145 [Acutalibacteraceae bacterium]